MLQYQNAGKEEKFVSKMHQQVRRFIHIIKASLFPCIHSVWCFVISLHSFFIPLFGYTAGLGTTLIQGSGKAPRWDFIVSDSSFGVRHSLLAEFPAKTFWLSSLMTYRMQLLASHILSQVLRLKWVCKCFAHPLFRWRYRDFDAFYFHSITFLRCYTVKISIFASRTLDYVMKVWWNRFHNIKVRL